jgi:WD40 repeat protein
MLKTLLGCSSFISLSLSLTPALATTFQGTPGTANEIALKGHTRLVEEVAISPSGKLAASAGLGRNELFLWSLPDGKKIANLDWPKFEDFRALAFTPDGKELAVLFESRLAVWDLDKRAKTEWPDFKASSAIAFSVDGNWVAHDYLEELVVRNWNTKSIKKKYPGHIRGITRICFSKDSKYVIAADLEWNLHVWNMNTGERSLLRGHKHKITGIVATGNANTIVSSSWDKKVVVWNLEKQAMRKIIECDGEVSCLSISTPSNILAFGTHARGIHVWDLKNDACVGVFMNDKEPPFINAISVSPDETRLLAGSSRSFLFDDKLGTLTMLKIRDGK